MGGGGQTQKTDNSPWAGQQPYLTKGFGEASNLYDSGPQQFFPGQTYTDMDPTRQAGLFGAANMASSGNPVANNAANYASRTLGGGGDNPYGALLGSGARGMMDTASGSSLGGNPYLDQQYDLAAGKLGDSFKNTIMPSIAAQFGQSGGAGSTMHEELATRAGGELGDSLAHLGSEIYGGNYQQERDRQVQAQQGLTSTGAGLYNTGVNEKLNLANNAGTIRGAQFDDFGRLQDVGKEYEGQAGKQLEDNINRFNFNQNAPYAALQDYMSMIQGNYGGTSTTRSSGGSGAMQGIGAALSIASMFSDARLKDIIAHVATTKNGLKLYTFTWKDDIFKKVYVGLMAQEVAEVCPEAVTQHKGGHLMVDYGKALELA